MNILDEKYIESWFLNTKRYLVHDFAKQVGKEEFEFTLQIYNSGVLREYLYETIDKEAIKYLQMPKFLIHWENRVNPVIMNIVVVADLERDCLITLENMDAKEKYELLNTTPERQVFVITLLSGESDIFKRIDYLKNC
jgi:hypothetical protein